MNAFDADEVQGLGHPVDLHGRPLRRITKEQWRRVEDWRHYWDEVRLRRFLAQAPTVVLCGASDNMFELARLFDRRIFLQASWRLLRGRLDDPLRDNDWGREPAQRAWVKNAARAWPSRARAAGFEFVDAALPLDEIYRRLFGAKPGIPHRPQRARG